MNGQYYIYYYLLLLVNLVSLYIKNYILNNDIYIYYIYYQRIVTLPILFNILYNSLFILGGPHTKKFDI